MILSLLIALLACAWLAGRLGRRRLRLAGVALAMVAVFAIGCGPVPHLLLGGWQAPYAHRPALDWAPSNAIVLLTANTNNPPGDGPEPGPVGYVRVAETMSLYNACRATGMHCTVLVSGGDAYATGEPLAQVYGKALARLGLPAADMVLEPRSRTTWQNAEFAQAPLARIGAQRVWLVSSALHLRRAEFAFRHFGIAVTPVRADYARNAWSLLPLAGNLSLTDQALHEYAGMALYRWYAWCHRAGAPAESSAPPAD
ncbi:YdcF family protein [Rhodanobacter sp. Si-c]|uniref:YdcF family protein n=1 Tax=Rhodanobacter lycopersici TaxID=3162487 RepID=A0ABV3Q8X5_9GAMM